MPLYSMIIFFSSIKGTKNDQNITFYNFFFEKKKQKISEKKNPWPRRGFGTTHVVGFFFFF